MPQFSPGAASTRPVFTLSGTTLIAHHWPSPHPQRPHDEPADRSRPYAPLFTRLSPVAGALLGRLPGTRPQRR